MRKLLIVPLIAFLAIALSAQEGFAQTRGPRGPSLRKSNRPTTSPYLNLLQGGGRGGNNNIGFNYFQRVRPEVDLRNQNNQMQGSLDNLQQQVNSQQQQLLKQSAASSLTPTGHAATFMSYGNYFPSAGSGRR